MMSTKRAPLAPALGAITAVALAIVVTGEGASAAEITSAGFDRGGINPSRPAFDTDTLRVELETDDASVDVRITLTGAGEDRTLAETTTAGPFVLAVHDTTGGGDPLPEGEYAVRVELTDTAGVADTTLVFLVDETAPAFASLALTGPMGSFANGDYLPLEAIMTEPIVAFSLDVSEIDDTGDGSAVLVEAHDDTTYALLYRISPENGIEDGDDLPLTATATDRFGNAGTSEEVRICLSTFPPLFEAKNLVDAAGDTLPDDTAFTSGDTVRLRTMFQTRFGAPAAPELAIEATADFTDLDTEFHPFTNPAVQDTAFGDSLPDGEALAIGYVYRITTVHRYTLSAENLRQEGTYDVVVSARDDGCGVAVTDPEFRVRLADLGPEPPTLDALDSEIVTGSRLTLAGSAPGAAGVRIARDDGAALADAVLDTITDRFTADVTLDPGRNRLVAIADDGLGHDSDPSEVLEVYRIEDATLTVGPRVRPGDPIEVALLSPADRLDLDIFNLAGDRIWHDTMTNPGAIHAFTWNGRTRRGDAAQSGPYIARVTIHAQTGKRALNEAFVFTRK
jgi:hypothetical protein